MLVNFVILQMEEDKCTLIMLGRPFLATTGCHINVKNGKLSFDVGDDLVEFNLIKASNFPSMSIGCHRIDVIDYLIREEIINHASSDPLEHYILNDGTTKDKHPEVEICA